MLKSNWSWVVLLAVAGNISAQTIINDGTSTNNLIPLSNSDPNGSGSAQASLTLNNGTLLASQENETGNFPFRTVWHSTLLLNINHYAVLADFKAADATDANRGGVMGWLDPLAAKGIAFQIVPNPDTADPEKSLLQVKVVDFLAADEETNESVTNLFNLDGTPADSSTNSASTLVSYNASTNFATMRLDFTAPTAADQAALSDVTAHIVAKMLLPGTNNLPTQVGTSIELLTNLPLPPSTNHTFGYYAYWGQVFGFGPIGELDNLAVTGSFQPTVTLSSPSDGAKFSAPAAITVVATAEPLGFIRRVDFFANGLLVGTATNSPFAINWTNVAAGNYSLTAMATDALEATATSAPVDVTVTTPTSVVLASPANGASFTQPANVTLTAAPQPIGSIQQVDFFNGDQLLGTVTNSPYTITWSNVLAGNYTLTAQATDALGVMATSAPVTITVSPPPTVVISNPTNGATFSAPASITVAATAGPDGFIRQVDFFSNGQLLGTATNSPFAFNWNNVGAGSYSLTAQATDANGVSATSAPIAITVTGQTAGSPPLTIVLLGNQVVISWSASFTGFTLQSSTNLIAWTTIPSANNSATVPATAPGEYFRLIQSGQPMPPPLSIVSAGNFVIVSWPSTYTGFTLQANSDLTTGNWPTVPTSGNTTTLPATGPVKLFRLFKQ